MRRPCNRALVVIPLIISAGRGAVNSRVLVFARELDHLCSTLTRTTTAITTIGATTIPVTHTVTGGTGTPMPPTNAASG